MESFRTLFEYRYRGWYVEMTLDWHCWCLGAICMRPNPGEGVFGLSFGPLVFSVGYDGIAG